MQSDSTIRSRINSHLSRLTSMCPRQMKPEITATGATKPHANSVAVCRIFLEEKSVQSTVQEGRINPGNAAGGTSHCQCADGGCSSRAEPWTRSRIASHAGAERPKEREEH